MRQKEDGKREKGKQLVCGAQQALKDDHSDQWSSKSAA